MKEIFKSPRHTQTNKDENVHRFALSAISEGILERERKEIERKRERERKSERERERVTNNIKCEKKCKKQV